MITVIVSNQQCTLRYITMSQALYMQISRLRSTRQFFAIIDKQPPTLILVFCDTSANLMSAAMDYNVHIFLLSSINVPKILSILDFESFVSI